MSITQPAIAVGTVFDDHSVGIGAFEDLFEMSSTRIQVVGLAGPNELIQFLANAPAWAKIGTAILTIYGSAIVAEAGKDTWKALAPKLLMAPSAAKQKFLNLVAAIRSEHANDQTVSIGLIEPTFDLRLRRDRLYIPRPNDTSESVSPEEVARYLVVFSQCARPIAEWLSQEYNAYPHDYKPFVDMTLSDEGHLVVTFSDGDYCARRSGVYRRTYNSHGQIVKEESSD